MEKMGLWLRLAAGRRPLVRGFASYAPEPEPEWTETPKYPPILCPSKGERLKREREAEIARERRLETVEEKLLWANMPRYYGWRVFDVSEEAPLGGLPVAQFSTRTHLRPESETLPDRYLPLEMPAQFLATQLRPRIERAIAYEFSRPRRPFVAAERNSVEKQKNKAVSESVIKQVNRILLNELSPKAPHLINSEVDDKPRHEAFWFVGNIKPNRVGKFLSNQKYFHDTPFQYMGEPVLTVRNTLPLEPLMPFENAGNADLEVPVFTYNPTRVGYHLTRTRAVTSPGFWPGDPAEFGQISYHTRHRLLDRFMNASDEDVSDMLATQGIMATYGWLLAQASLQGFSTLTETTYPLVSQTVITDGRLWSLFAYQLNTTANHKHHSLQSKLKNVCYRTPPMKLFESVGEDGRLEGFDENVLKKLIQFYLNAPKARENTEMKPYLGETVRHLADIEDVERRTWLENKLKQITARTPHKYPIYEIYPWEYIYKIKFPTRPMDARKRPFETFERHPFLRRLDEHRPVHIPKKLQKKGPKRFVYHQKLYYPK